MNISLDPERNKFYSHQLAEGKTLAENEILYNMAKNGYFHDQYKEWLILTAFENGTFDSRVYLKSEIELVETKHKTLILFSDHHNWQYIKCGAILTDRSIIYAPLKDGMFVADDAQ